MAYTEKTSASWFDRMGGSFRGILFGLGVILGGSILLWWNEGSFVSTRDALNEAHAVTQELGSISRLDTSKRGQLVHATGLAETKDILVDPVLGLSINAIRLERQVEFYQWVEQSHSEKRKKLGGGEETVTTYSYEPQWVDSPVDSAKFKDPDAKRINRNSVLANLENFKAQAGNVKLGAYRLPDFMIDSIKGATPLNVTLSDETLVSLNKSVNQAKSGSMATGQSMVHVSGNTVILGRSPATPKIGDVRITIQETRAGMVSILGKSVGDTFEKYRAENGNGVGMLVMGTHSIDNMYGDAHSSNSMMTWIVRFAGAFLVIFGLGRIVAPLAVFASVIPLLGSIVGAGTGIVSVLLGAGWSLLVISTAWLRFRPVVGLAMISVSVAFVVFLYIKGRSGKAATIEAGDNSGK